MDLARRDPKGFSSRFVPFSGIVMGVDDYEIVSYFGGKGRLNDLIELSKHIVTLHKSFYLMFLKNRSATISALSRHLTNRPQDFNVLCYAQYPSVILSLLCSELPMETLKDLLDTVFNFKIEKFLEIIGSVILFSAELVVADRKILGERLCLLIDHYKTIQLSSLAKGSSISEFDLLEHYKVAAKSFFGNLHLTAEEAQELSKSEPAKNVLCFILLRSGMYEEAFKYLPCQGVEFTEFYSQLVGDEDFCSLIAERRPEWVREHFQSLQKFVFSNLNLMETFFDVDSFEKLADKGKSERDIFILSRRVFSRGSLDVVKVFARLFGADDVSETLKAVFYCGASSERIAEVLEALMLIEPLAQMVRENKDLLDRIDWNPEVIIAIVGRGGADLFKKIVDPASQPKHDISKFLCEKFNLMLRREKLQSKMISLRAELLSCLPENGTKNFEHLLTPSALYYASIFYGIPLSEHSNLLLN